MEKAKSLSRITINIISSTFGMGLFLALKQDYAK